MANASPLKNASIHPQLNIWQTSAVFDDFYVYSSGSGGWTTSPSGSAALITGSDYLRLTSNGADNNPVGIRSTQQAFYLQPGRGQYAEAYVHLVNQSSNNSNIAFGFSSDTSLGITDGAAPSTSMTSCLLLKLDGEAYFRAFSSNAATNTSTLSQTLAPDGFYCLRVDVFNYDSLNAGVSFSVNGYPLKDSNGVGIIHKVAWLNAANMYAIIQTQGGSANAQSLDIDYASAGKNRLVSF